VDSDARNRRWRPALKPWWKERRKSLRRAWKTTARRWWKIGFRAPRNRSKAALRRSWKRSLKVARTQWKLTVKAWLKSRRSFRQTFWLFLLALLTQRDDPRNRLLRAYLENDLARLESRFPLRLIVRQPKAAQGD
jgi:hypothetical protein